MWIRSKAIVVVVGAVAGFLLGGLFLPGLTGAGTPAQKSDSIGSEGTLGLSASRARKRAETLARLYGYPFAGPFEWTESAPHWDDCYKDVDGLFRCATIFVNIPRLARLLRTTNTLSHERFVRQVARAQLVLLPELRSRLPAAVDETGYLEFQAKTTGPDHRTLHVWKEGMDVEKAEGIFGDMWRELRWLRFAEMRASATEYGEVVFKESIEAPLDTTIAKPQDSTLDGPTWETEFRPNQKTRERLFEQTRIQRLYREPQLAVFLVRGDFTARLSQPTVRTRKFDLMADAGHAYLFVPYEFTNWSEKSRRGLPLDVTLRAANGETYQDNMQPDEHADLSVTDPGETRDLWSTFEIPKDVLDQPFELVVEEAHGYSSETFVVSVDPEQVPPLKRKPISRLYPGHSVLHL